MNAQENKQLVHRMIEKVWNRHNLDKVSEFIGDELIAEALEHDQQFLAAFPDVHVTIEDLVGEGDKIVARLHVKATNTGPFAGQPPTGRQVQFRSIRIYRIADGRIVETWAMQDRFGLMEQLGLVQSAGGNVNWAAGDNHSPT